VSRVEHLPETPDSPAIARGLVRSEWTGCNPEAVAAAQLIISELVTNAVVHGSSPIQVEFHREADLLRAAVTDGGTGRPVARVSEERDPHGRGLHIVRSLAHDWGVVEYEAGKTVWFTLLFDDHEPLSCDA
jgi:anti-sigma regulatory factor (Ser/Thr protein kinase)